LEYKNTNLEEIQTILNEPLVMDLQQTMTEFWKWVARAVKEPDNLTVRAFAPSKGKWF
jgi:flagellar hook-associated protein FlgK